MSSDTGWNPRIEGLRGLSILLVLVLHFTDNRTHRWGLGVNIFFIISGFVITSSLMRENSKNPISQRRIRSFLGHFYIRRLQRLLPIALLVIVATTVLSILVSGTDRKHYLLSALSCLLYIGNLLSFFSNYPELAPGLGHFWSLAVEAQFYLIWPILFFLAARYSRNFTNFSKYILITIVLIQVSHPLISATGTSVWTLPTTYFDLLLLGCGLRIIYHRIHHINQIFLRILQLAGFLSIFTILLVPYSSNLAFINYFHYNFAFLLSALTFFLALTTDVFNFSGLRFLGKISYSLYCIHLPIIIFTRELFGESLILLCSTVLLTLLLSYISNRFYESKFYLPTIKSLN